MLTTIPGLGSIPPQCSILRLGFIGLGEKNDKNLPQKTDHFTLPPELEKAFSSECKSLPILLPSNDREMFCGQQWRREVKVPGGGRKAMCRGNGAGEGMQKIKGGDDKWKWQEFSCVGYDCSYAKDKNKSCKITADFKFYVVINGMLSSGIYQITTHNKNSMRNINAQTEEVFKEQFGRVDMLPLWLNLVPDEGRDAEDKLYKYFSLSLTLRMTENMAIAFSRNSQRLLVDTSYPAEPEPEKEVAQAPEKSKTTPSGKSEKAADTKPAGADDFNDATEAHKLIRKYAARVKALNHLFANAWLSTLCKKYGAANGEVEEIIDHDRLKELIAAITAQGLELKAAQETID